MTHQIMNRPKIEDSLTRRTYTDELERYCDTLEKALDKACEILVDGYCNEYATYQYFYDLDTMVDIPYGMTEKQWKEWLLKDE